MSIGVRHLYPMTVVGPSYFADFPYHLFHLEPHLLLVDWFLTLGVKKLLGYYFCLQFEHCAPIYLFSCAQIDDDAIFLEGHLVFFSRQSIHFFREP